MRVIGITGGVGAGKSAILKYLTAISGVRVVEADEVGHLLMEPGMECFEKIRAHFGERVLTPDGQLDRAAVAKIVFADKKELDWQSELMHPAIKNWIRREIEKERQQGACALFVVEAALLIEIIMRSSAKNSGISIQNRRFEGRDLRSPEAIRTRK
ncbi:MAG: dephospho-CoA kinase [Anaerosacchariphilus sp.]